MMARVLQCRFRQRHQSRGAIARTCIGGAEAVATALTNVFDIAPENMETQGYGEQYLKVETQEPERENRRVAIRRITPLVAPVASSE
jgi:hypothetical protein